MPAHVSHARRAAGQDQAGRRPVETRTHEGDDTIVEIEPLDDRESSRQAVEKAREELRGNELMIEVPSSRGSGSAAATRRCASPWTPRRAPTSTPAHGVRGRPAAGRPGVDRRRQRLRRAVRRAGRRQRHVQDGLGRSLGRGHRPRRQPEHRLRRRPGRVGRRPGVGQAGLGRRRDRSGGRGRQGRLGLRRRRPARGQPRRDLGQVGVRRHQGRRRRGHQGLARRQLDERRHPIRPRSVGRARDQDGESLRLKATSTSGDVRITALRPPRRLADPVQKAGDGMVVGRQGRGSRSGHAPHPGPRPAGPGRAAPAPGGGWCRTARCDRRCREGSASAW